MAQNGLKVLYSIIIAIVGLVVGLIVFGAITTLLFGDTDGEINGGLRSGALIVLGGIATAVYAVYWYLKRQANKQPDYVQQATPVETPSLRKR